VSAPITALTLAAVLGGLGLHRPKVSAYRRWWLRVTEVIIYDNICDHVSHAQAT